MAGAGARGEAGEPGRGERPRGRGACDPRPLFPAAASPPDGEAGRPTAGGNFHRRWGTSPPGRAGTYARVGNFPTAPTSPTQPRSPLRRDFPTVGEVGKVRPSPPATEARPSFPTRDVVVGKLPHVGYAPWSPNGSAGTLAAALAGRPSASPRASSRPFPGNSRPPPGSPAGVEIVGADRSAPARPAASTAFRLGRRPAVVSRAARAATWAQPRSRRASHFGTDRRAAPNPWFQPQAPSDRMKAPQEADSNGTS